MINYINKFINHLHTTGIKVPLVRDGRKPSVSLTLLFISSLFVIFGLLNMFQISFYESLAWHVTSAVLYYNRSAKINKDGFEISSKE